jgi:hypothetical protein
VTFAIVISAARQSTYGKRFGLDSVYTPQMVVDGSSEFSGTRHSEVN